MTRPRLIRAALVTLALSTAMHLDWHAARPAVHHLSLGWAWHWLLAVPVFALTAWYVLKDWAQDHLRAALAIIGIASVLAAVVEPTWELYVDGAPVEWTFGQQRLVAFAAFLLTGVVTHVVAVFAATRAT